MRAARVGGLDLEPALAGRPHPRGGASGGVLGSLLAPRLSLVLGGLVAVAVGWGLRFRQHGRRRLAGGGQRGSDAPPASWLRWSATAGRFYATWPSPVAGPTSTTR
jgi:hypothetical protein